MTTFCRPSKTLTFSCASDSKGWHNTDTGVNPWSMRMEFTGWKPVLLVTDCTDRCCRQIVETREKAGSLRIICIRGGFQPRCRLT
ncbi:MAG: hypothetical protein IK005_11470 [Paludibacteraceae bacterium]|nr:hypothetical protein [Paludibacteraceae bacterium]